MLVTMLVSLYTTRIVLKTLGVDNYGIYNVVGGIVVFFTFINAGLAGATKRYVLAELAVGDLSTQRKVYSLAINAHLLIVSGVFFVGETIGLWMLYHAINIPEGRMHAAMMVYQASLLTAILGILRSPFSSIIISFEKMSVFAYLSILDVLLKLGIVFLIQVIDGDKLIWYGFLLSIIALFDISFYFIYCRRKFEICRYVRTNDRSTFYSLLKYVWWTLFGSGSNVLSNQGVSLLINNFFSVAVNAAMGVSNMIVNSAMQFVSNLQVVFAPQLTKNYISKDYLALMKLILLSSRYSCYLMLVILIPIFLVIPDLLDVWLGKYPEYTEEFCVLSLVCFFIESVSLPLTTVITSEKNIKKYQIYISCLYVAIFFLSWVLLLFDVLPYMVLLVRGFVGIAMVAVRLYLVRKKVSAFSVSQWCLAVYGKAVLLMLLSLPLLFISDICMFNETISRLIALGSISVLWVSMVIFLCGLSHNERTFVLAKLKIIK